MKKLLSLLFGTALLVIGLATIVLAATWEYKFPITATDNTSTSRTYLPVMLGFGGQSLIDAGKINTNGLDTNMQIGSTSIKYMMSTTNVTAVIPNLPANGKATLDLYTGYSPIQAVFAIITGTGGYFTTPDLASIELGNNFTVDLNGYIVTSNATGKYLARKTGAFYSFVSPTVSGNITSRIPTYGNAFSADAWTDVGATIGINGGQLQWDVLMNLDARSYYDLGISLISDSMWGLDFAFQPTTHPVDNGNAMAFGLWSNTANYNAYANDAIVLLWTGGGTNTFKVQSIDGGVVTSSAAINGVYGTTYYVRLARNSPTSVQLSIFSDEDMTTHVSGSPVTVATAATVTGLRYLQLSNQNAALNGRETGYIDDLAYFNANVYTVTATGVTTGEHTIKSEQKTGISLDGVDDVISYGDPGDGDLDVGTGNFTYEIVLAGQQDGLEKGLIGKGNTVAPAAGIWYLYLTPTNRLTAYLYNSTYAKTLNSQSIANYLSDNLTHRIGVAVDRTNNIIDIYVDGVEVTYVSDSVVGGGFSIADSLNTTKYLVIGGYETTADTSNRLLATNPGEGTFYEARLYKRYIGAAEMLAHAQGTFSNNTNLMLNTAFNEGSGNTSVDSSGNGNTATGYTGLVASATWWARQRVIVDGTQYTPYDYSTPVSVPDNSNSWSFLKNNVASYANSVNITVNQALQAWYQPSAMLSGATLPDRQGGNNDATIIWGNNNGIELLYGEMTSSDSTSSGAGTTGGFGLPSAFMPSTWFAMGENVENLPFYDMVHNTVVAMDFPDDTEGVQTIYFIIIVGIAFAVMMGLVVFTRSALAGFMGMIIVLFIGSSMTVIPMWIPFSILLVGISIMYLYRQVAY